ncbi:MAG TPA: hypothetical protein PLN21_06180 [Gemmatales bacterium]|nr:hypothetical protein [Gemmatales bacterium]
MSPVNETQTELPQTTPKQRLDFPLYVRILAVAHVLSLILGPVGCVILGAIARFLWLRRGLDSLVIGLSLAGFGWLFFWVAFRWWFVRWGRKNWPETVNGDEQNTSGG